MSTHENVLAERSWFDLISERFSIEIDPHRQSALHDSIEKYAQSIGESSESLMRRAERRELDAAHWSRVIHLSTNHETRLFRYVPTLELIGNLVEGKACPKVLSIGCSTGEEVYSIATTLLRRGHAKFAVHGTDVSDACIKVAKEGIYKSHPDIGPDVAAPAANGFSRFHLWVRDYVSFEQNNVMGVRPIAFTKPDIIITQNMLIYYKVESRHEILAKLGMLLPKGGYLITGPAEDGAWVPSGLARIQSPIASLFRKF